MSISEEKFSSLPPSFPIAITVNGHRLFLPPAGEYRGLPHFFLGSVAERVVRLSPVPVLTVRTGDILLPKISNQEPLSIECRHFVDCVSERKRPLTDGEAGRSVVAALE